MYTDDIWNDLFGGFEDLNRKMNDVFAGMDTPGIRSYGYTVYQGPDGVRHVSEFGNRNGTLAPASDEPFTDVSEEDEVVRIVADIPGMSKENIDLRCTPNALSIRAEGRTRAFYKDLALPCDVDPDSAKAEYNNGVLEVTLDRIATAEEGVKVRIA